MAEQRYLAVLAVIAEGYPVCSVAQQWSVSRQTLHAWLGRYEAGGLEELADRSRSLPMAQAAIEEWVDYYNTQRPHQSLDMATPADRFGRPAPAADPVITGDRSSDDWVARRVGVNGVVCVSWQQVSVGKHHASARCDVQVGEHLLQFWIGNELCKTVARTSRGEVRKKPASIPQPRN